MNIFCSANGTIFHVDPEPIYQGSVGVNKVRFIGQFPSSSQVLMSYKLPQGDYTMPKFMASVAELQEVQAPNGGKFSVWEALIGASPKIDTETGQVVKDENGQVLYDLDYTITQDYGTATLQFFVYGAGTAVLADGVLQNTGYGRLATASTSFNILKGVPVIIPDLETDENQELLTQILNIVANTQELYADASQRLNVAEQYIQDLNNDVEDLKAQAEDFEADIDNLQNKTNENAAKINQNTSELANLRPVVIQIGANVEGLTSVVATTNGKVEQNTSDIEGLRQDIINEAHFRGYVETNAQIQALQGNANDYAYSAESGTVWVYQNGGWVNSGRPVPDQMTPASNTTPLMDGTASVGSENAYARGDHRHPTDTTRIGVNEKGQANGIASLNEQGQVPSAQLPPLNYLPLTGGTVEGEVRASTFEAINTGFYIGETTYIEHEINDGDNSFSFPNKSGTLALQEPIDTQLALINQIISQSGIMYTADNTASWNDRVTADGANVLDESKAVLKKVVGSTVKSQNLFDGTLLTGYYNSADFTIEGANSAIYRSLKINLPAGTYRLHFSVEVQLMRTLVNGGFATGGAWVFTTNDGGEVGFSFRAIDSTAWKDEYLVWITEGESDKPYTPYFTGLKSSSFAGIESTNADGTKTSTLVFPLTETPEGTIIDFVQKAVLVNNVSTPFTSAQLANLTFATDSNGNNLGAVYTIYNGGNESVQGNSNSEYLAKNELTINYVYITEVQ